MQSTNQKYIYLPHISLSRCRRQTLAYLELSIEGSWYYHASKEISAKKFNSMLRRVSSMEPQTQSNLQPSESSSSLILLEIHQKVQGQGITPKKTCRKRVAIAAEKALSKIHIFFSTALSPQANPIISRAQANTN